MPPDCGMAVANSDFESTLGKMNSPENIYANQRYSPIIPAATPGRTKIPVPSIPPILIAITAGRVNFLSSFFKCFIVLKYKNILLK